MYDSHLVSRLNLLPFSSFPTQRGSYGIELESLEDDDLDLYKENSLSVYMFMKWYYALFAP